MTIKAVVFDLGGVLVPAGGKNIRKGVANYLGINESDLKGRTSDLMPDLYKGGITLVDYYREVIKRFNIESKDAEEILEQHLMFYNQFSSRVDPEIAGLVGRLKDEGIVVASMTNTEREIFQRSGDHGYFRIFDMNFISTEMGMTKSQYEFHGRILDELRVSPRELVGVDDEIKMVQLMCKMGINGILHEYGNLTSSEISLRSLGVKI